MDFWNRDANVDNRHVDTAWEREGGKNLESDIYTLPGVKQIASGKLLYTRGLDLVLCDDLEGWDGGRREARGKRWVYVHIQWVHFIVQQKPTQHSKPITLH